MDKANMIESESAKRRWDKEIGIAHLMLEVLAVFYMTYLFLSSMEIGQQGIQCTAFSHTQCRPLHFSRCLHMQNKLMSAYIAGQS